MEYSPPPMGGLVSSSTQKDMVGVKDHPVVCGSIVVVAVDLDDISGRKREKNKTNVPLFSGETLKRERCGVDSVYTAVQPHYKP